MRYGWIVKMIVKMAKALKENDEVELRGIIDFFEKHEGVVVDRKKLVEMMEKKGIVRVVRKMDGDVLVERLMLVRPAKA